MSLRFDYVYPDISSASDLSSRLGPSQPGEQRQGTAVWRVAIGESYAYGQPTVIRKRQSNAAKPGGRAPPSVPPPDAPRGTLQWRARADTGCRVSQRLARITYGRVRNSTIPCIQLNVDVETTYETSEMKQPKRSGLAWSWQRRSSPQSGVVTLFEALRQHPHPPINPIITTGLTGTTPASATRPQRSLNCGLRALLAPSPTSSLSTGLLAHSFLVRCACRPRRRRQH